MFRWGSGRPGCAWGSPGARQGPARVARWVWRRRMVAMRRGWQLAAARLSLVVFADCLNGNECLRGWAPAGPAARDVGAHQIGGGFSVTAHDGLMDVPVFFMCQFSVAARWRPGVLRD